MGKKLLALDLWVLVASEQDWEGQVENCLFVCLFGFFSPSSFICQVFWGRKETNGEMCIQGGFNL